MMRAATMAAKRSSAATDKHECLKRRISELSARQDAASMAVDYRESARRIMIKPTANRPLRSQKPAFAPLFPVVDDEAFALIISARWTRQSDVSNTKFAIKLPAHELQKKCHNRLPADDKQH